MPDPLIEARGVTRRFDGGRVVALAGVDLALRDGECVAVGTWTADPVFTAVFVWAALGIVDRSAGITDPVRLAAAAGGAAVAVVTLIIVARRLSGAWVRA